MSLATPEIHDLFPIYDVLKKMRYLLKAVT